jgi:hypothetical protein
MELTIGVLIVGSLYWDNKPHRKEWRRARLNMDEEFIVRAPIRYGRRAGTRANTFTMVFSRSCIKKEYLGQAKVVRCKKPVSSLNDLLAEAKELWIAEQTKPDPKPDGLSANWGCVALLVNPDNEKRNIIPQKLLDAWAEHVAPERENYKLLKGTADEGRLINDCGVLNIGWPTLKDGDGPIPLDLLIATATKPTLEDDRYPGLEIIVRAWKDDPKGHVEYFWCNRCNEISTFQDNEIVLALRSNTTRT